MAWTVLCMGNESRCVKHFGFKKLDKCSPFTVLSSTYWGDELTELNSNELLNYTTKVGVFAFSVGF